MTETSSRLEIEAINALPEEQRAAAIMHFIYIQTIERPEVDWETRLAPTWATLDERAKDFNLAVLETWTKHPELLRTWTRTIQAMTASLADAPQAIRKAAAPLPSGEGLGAGRHQETAHDRSTPL